MSLRRGASRLPRLFWESLFLPMLSAAALQRKLSRILSPRLLINVFPTSRNAGQSEAECGRNEEVGEGEGGGREIVRGKMETGLRIRDGRKEVEEASKNKNSGAPPGLPRSLSLDLLILPLLRLPKDPMPRRAASSLPNLLAQSPSILTEV